MNIKLFTIILGLLNYIDAQAPFITLQVDNDGDANTNFITD